jgi:hypothetical protein
VHDKCALVSTGGTGLRRRARTGGVARCVSSTCCAAGEGRERASRSRPHCGFPSTVSAIRSAVLVDAPTSLSSAARSSPARAGLRKSIWHAEATVLRLCVVAGVGKGRVGESEQISAVTRMVTVDHIWSNAHRQSRVSGASAEQLQVDQLARRVTAVHCARCLFGEQERGVRICARIGGRMRVRTYVRAGVPIEVHFGTVGAGQDCRRRSRGGNPVPSSSYWPLLPPGACLRNSISG